MSKGLLLIDIQNDYFSGGRSELVEPEKALLNAAMALTRFRNQGLPVIHVQHINLREGATFFLPCTDGVKIHEKLTPQPEETIIIKHVPNSFHNTNLLSVICEKGISELIVCGMMTHMCIDTTVRGAKDHNIPVVILEDACATKDLNYGGRILPAETVNKVFFGSLNQMFAKIIPTSALVL